MKRVPLVVAGLVVACSGKGDAVAPAADAGADAPPAVAAGCEARAPAALGTGYFVDVSEKAGIQAGNFDPAPPMPLASNDHSRLAFADIDGDGWDDIVATNLFPDPASGA